DLRAKLTCVDTEKLDVSFVGREFNSALLSALPPEADPCGENGEFHSFVYAGPMLSDAIISSARARVGRPQTGNIGSSPVPFNCFSRYPRTSSRNKSPKATPSIPSATAFAQVAAIIDSY